MTEDIDSILGIDSSRKDPPSSSHGLPGFLLIVAGISSPGLTSGDPTQISLMTLLVMLCAFVAAGLSLAGKRPAALGWTWVFVIVTGLFSIAGLGAHPIMFLIRGGLGCVLGAGALLFLIVSKQNPTQKSE